MKIKIKTFNDELPSYLTLDKEYQLDTIDDFLSGDIYLDNGSRMFINISECAHLNGGSWEIVNE